MGSAEPPQAAAKEKGEARSVVPPRGWLSPAAALPKGERLELLMKPAMVWIFLRTPGRFAVHVLLLISMFVWGVLLGHGLWGLGTELVGVVVLLLAAQLTWNVLNYEARWYAVTERRLMAIGGVLGRYSTEIPLSSVRAIVVSRPWLERLLGVGSVGFGSAATGGLEVLWVGVHGADETADRVRAQVAGPTVVKTTRKKAARKAAVSSKNASKDETDD